MSEAQKECDVAECGNPAVVHWTQVVDSKSSTQYLCKDCAAAKGISTDPPAGMDVSGFLAQLGHKGASPPPDPGGPCEFCGLAFKDFRETGRLGCSHCFTTFDGSMRRLLERIHGASRHTGKVYLPPDPGTADITRRLDGLRRSLLRAIEAEDFERAAVLRDEIREHEPGGNTR